MTLMLPASEVRRMSRERQAPIRDMRAEVTLATGERAWAKRGVPVSEEG